MKRVLNLVKRAAKAYFKLSAQNYVWRYTGNTYIDIE